MKEYKIAILGNEDAILGFRGLGVDAFGLTAEAGERTARETLSNGDYAVVFITEDWLERLGPVLEDHAAEALPAIVPVPAPQGSTGASLRNLKKIVELAVGSDILFKDN